MSSWRRLPVVQAMILLDLNLPPKDGPQVLAFLKTHDEDLLQGDLANR
jgi:hypothetical protein